MPRIRYRRDYDFRLYEQPDEDSLSENGENGEENDRQENPSGASWLSNSAIASQLSNAKIKQVITSLKAQISVLETELLSRHLSNSSANSKNWRNIGNARSKQNKQNGEERLYPKVIGRTSKRRNATFKKVASLRLTLKKLGVANVDELLATWSKIQEKDKTK